MRTRHHYTSWFLLLLAAMTLWAFWPLYTGAYTLRGEAADLLIPVFSHIREALLQGDWPTWNRYQNQGIATVLSPMYWNPIYLLCGVLFSSPGHALNAVYLMMILTGGLGFYKLSGLVLTDKRIAMMGGLCYPLAGFYVIQGPYIDLITTAAWLPLLLYASLMYQKDGTRRYLILLGMGYYFFATGTSAGFNILIVIIIMAIQLYHLKGLDTSRTRNTAMTLFAAGFLIWRIYWLRWHGYTNAPGFGSQKTSVAGGFQDLTSLVLSKTSVLHPGLPDLSGSIHFSSYMGIIILSLALYSMWQSRTKTDQKLGIFCLLWCVLSVLSPIADRSFAGISGMVGSPFTAGLKIMLAGSLLLLGLSGFQKIMSNPKPARIPFLLLAVVFAVFALCTRVGVTGLTTWFGNLDLWKSSLFLLLTGLLCWLDRANIRLIAIGGLIIADTGMSNVLHQEKHLYNTYPSSAFSSQINFPEKRTKPVDLTIPVGKYSDQDFKIASLNRNTGTLIKQVVRDGYWPWMTRLQAETTGNSEREKQLRYPMFFYSKDTTRQAVPSYTNFDDPIDILSQTDHSWKLSIQSKYEKYLIFNQNYDKNWSAHIDGDLVPVMPINAGMMRIAIPPGSHTITFTYQTDGLMHLFVVVMIVMILFAVMMVIKGHFPYSVFIVGWPVVFLLISSPQKQIPANSDATAQIPMDDSSSFKFNYEKHAPFWFTRPGQITTENSYDGYRSESLSPDGEYSATLQIPRQALRNKKELEYKFHLYTNKPIEAAIVLKTYSQKDDSYNIQHINSLNTGQWNTIEGRFSLQGLQGPLVKADFFIWNHKKKDFLIDDIRVRLIP